MTLDEAQDLVRKAHKLLHSYEARLCELEGVGALGATSPACCYNRADCLLELRRLAKEIGRVKQRLDLLGSDPSQELTNLAA